MIKPAIVLALPLLALAACNNSRDEDDLAARPTADVTASDIATGAATMIPPVGNPNSPANQTQTGPATTKAPTDAGRGGVNRSTGTNGSGANRPNAGATSEAIRKE
ncbi:MAG: hypothetical protein ACKOW1_03115 [Novosphingobium sp.]